ncbi:hypothetical protein GBAR_LOCUS23943 [Geodia barretti]|uniref:Ig-like domain-containing protein n=1 Tax=Geodia barretti TaxID=519541 RepID=A0AA35T808_GEOBA|nr:hypothetical protein GBAR_LOCUS23943 [Geodia barretti]
MKGTLLAALTLATIISGTLGVLSKHPETQTVAEGSTATFTCELRNCSVCFVHWTAIDTETGLHVSVNPQVVTEDNCITSTISILAVNNTVVQCEEYNRFARPKRERRHYSMVALLRVTEEQGRANHKRSAQPEKLTSDTERMNSTISSVVLLLSIATGALGVFIEHPQTQTAVEGSITDFNCTVKACSGCIVIWKIQRFEIGAEVYQPHSTVPKYVGHGLMLSTLHLVAVHSSAVQCERYNRYTRKSHFSEFAFLHVITSQDSLSGSGESQPVANSD